MAKGKPIGVRFDEEMLTSLKEHHGIDSPQKAVNFLYNYWRLHKDSQNPLAAIVRIETPEPKMVVEEPKIPTYESYKVALKYAGSVDEVKKIVANSARDPELAGWQKDFIKKYGIEVSQKLDF